MTFTSTHVHSRTPRRPSDIPRILTGLSRFASQKEIDFRWKNVMDRMPLPLVPVRKKPFLRKRSDGVWMCGQRRPEPEHRGEWLGPVAHALSPRLACLTWLAGMESRMGIDGEMDYVLSRL